MYAFKNKTVLSKCENGQETKIVLWSANENGASFKKDFSRWKKKKSWETEEISAGKQWNLLILAGT